MELHRQVDDWARSNGLSSSQAIASLLERALQTSRAPAPADQLDPIRNMLVMIMEMMIASTPKQAVTTEQLSDIRSRLLAAIERANDPDFLSALVDIHKEYVFDE